MEVCQPIMTPLVHLPPEIFVNTLQHSPELDLIRRSQTGDAEAFAQLVISYRPKIVSMVYGIVRNEQDAFDLAQEAFLKAWRSIDRFEGRSSFYTWLYTLTLNLTICSLRRKVCYKEMELDDAIPSSLPCPSVCCQRAEMRQTVIAAIAKLSPKHRSVIELKELEGLQYHEIAEVLNLSIGTVMSRLFNAKKHLRSLLEIVYQQTDKQ